MPQTFKLFLQDLIAARDNSRLQGNRRAKEYLAQPGEGRGHAFCPCHYEHQRVIGIKAQFQKGLLPIPGLGEFQAYGYTGDGDFFLRHTLFQQLVFSELGTHHVEVGEGMDPLGVNQVIGHHRDGRQGYLVFS